MGLLAASILSADFGRLAEDVKAVERAGADWIHVDVMDGHFVPNITIGPDVVKALRPVTRLPFDVHLMIEAPERYLANFVEAGADYLGVHVEACPHLHRTLQTIRELGARPCASLNPATPLSAVEWVIEDCAMVLLMTVNPGFGGQSFIGGMAEKVRALRKMIDDRGLSVILQVDGGVNVKTLPALAEAGVDCYVAGSAVFSGGDCAGNVRALRSLM